MASEANVRGLVKKAKTRDPEAFGMLYDEYVDQIFRYVYYKVGNLTESQDLTGQTFLKAFENINSYEMRDVAFSSWLYRIAHNLVVDFFRRESKRESVPIDDQPPTASPGEIRSNRSWRTSRASASTRPCRSSRTTSGKSWS